MPSFPNVSGTIHPVSSTQYFLRGTKFGDLLQGFYWPRKMPILVNENKARQGLSCGIANLLGKLLIVGAKIFGLQCSSSTAQTLQTGSSVVH